MPPELAADGIKGIRIRLNDGSDKLGSVFMRRCLRCTAAGCAAAVSLHSLLENIYFLLLFPRIIDPDDRKP